VTRFLTSLLPLALLLLPADARAQDWAGFYDRQTLVYWHGQTPPGIEENFREVVWPKLLPDEKRKLSRVTLDFPLEDARQLMNFYAVWGGGKQTITLPISSIRFLADIALAEAWLGVSGYSTDPVTDYLAMLKYQWPDRLAGRRYRPREALGIPDDATANPRVERRFQRDFGTAIVFVLGHELGHLYHQHGMNVSLERSRQQEEEADRFAMELMRRIGEPPVGMVLFFRILAHLAPYTSDPDYPARRAAATHPVASARLRAIAAGIETNVADFSRLGIATTTLTDFAGMVRDYAKLFDEEGMQQLTPAKRPQRQAGAAWPTQAWRHHRGRAPRRSTVYHAVLRQLPGQVARCERHRLRRGDDLDATGRRSARQLHFRRRHERRQCGDRGHRQRQHALLQLEMGRGVLRKGHAQARRLRSRARRYLGL
jgi:hypothetical protein